MSLEYADRTAFGNVEHGLIITLHPLRITTGDGRVAFDVTGYLVGDCPDTVRLPRSGGVPGVRPVPGYRLIVAV
ncbi:hypothetical protein [Nocardia sp. NPDC024068]|uniref:hypothetical protein n=1 Tax=Nocardia sp. NPDC024068 TaxID=3157197 RepID=UPI0033EA3597